MLISNRKEQAVLEIDEISLYPAMAMLKENKGKHVDSANKNRRKVQIKLYGSRRNYPNHINQQKNLVILLVNNSTKVVTYPKSKYHQNKGGKGSKGP